jgi:hypothetical protein
MLVCSVLYPTSTFLLPAEYQPEELDYFHEPLYDQLNTYGMRGFEIDIYNDPNGGLFYNRAANSLARMTVASNIPELKLPGLESVAYSGC